MREHLLKFCEDAVIKEASSYDEVIAMGPEAATSPFDAILVDLYMPGMERDEPTAALRSTCEAFPHTPVVVMSGTFDTPLVDAALNCGAKGFLPKTSKTKTIISALKLILDGEIYIPPSVMDAPKTSTMPVSDALQKIEAHPVSRLGPHEKTTLMLLVEGKTNKEIARTLNLTEITIKMQLRRAYRKLGAANRIDATRIVLEYLRLTES